MRTNTSHDEILSEILRLVTEQMKEAKKSGKAKARLSPQFGLRAKQIENLVNQISRRGTPASKKGQSSPGAR